MKKLVNIVMLVCLLLSRVAWADCDFSKGITKGVNGTYVYTEECHQKVGQLVKENSNQAAAIQDFTKAITMKDLALQDADKRANLWSQTAAGLEERIQKIDSLERSNQFIYFGLGVLATSLAVFSAAKLIGR